MKEKGFSNFISLLAILALNGVILSFVFSAIVFMKTSFNREWSTRSRVFQERKLKEILEDWTGKVYEGDNIEKIFERISKKGKEGDFNFENFLDFEILKEEEKEISFKFIASSRTWKGRYESISKIEGESKLFKGSINLSLFPLLIESSDSFQEVNLNSCLIPKEVFSFPFSIKLNLRDEVKESIKNSEEDIIYFDSLEEPILFINRDVEKIEFQREFNSQILSIFSSGKEVRLRIFKEGSIFEGYSGGLVLSRPCKLILINGKIDSITSEGNNVLIPALDLTIIASGPIKIEKPIDGANSLLGICSTGFNLINGEEGEAFIKISKETSSLRASLLSMGRIEIEGELILKGSLQAKNLIGKKLEIFVQDYLVSGINPSFYPLTEQNSLFIGKLNIEEWREE